MQSHEHTHTLRSGQHNVSKIIIVHFSFVFIRVRSVLAFQGPLAGEGPQGMMGPLDLPVNQVFQEALEFWDSQGEKDAGVPRVSTNHKHKQTHYIKIY